MAILLRILALASVACLGLGAVFFGLRVRGNPFGNPPIGRVPYFFAKVGVAVSMVLLFTAAAFDVPQLTTVPSVAALFLLLAGSAIFTLSMRSLGTNLRMGLPREETRLVTSGVYRISRNPIYAGLFLLMGGSLVYAFSWLNVAAVSLAVILHHCIVLAEERFLASRFKEYEAYRRRVRRYF